ncbi:glycosyltransferase [Polynucleobacter sp. MWH-Adler-W8]|uniref:glycosyltransferase n=1 Tax=Polynucleobacter sp. MWH-Adler-W8 TaxID=1819727 RepID=UPI00092756A9|nr:glycosyltransferase [Polynucleobacter sp. MWH-Adler-W8]OJI04672.1 hypothetical protein AOC28_06935 [Polynucleobacter sp. MWH-Adler-W8]
MQSKIFVITATYNCENFLPRLIQSLQKQTDNNFTWIIVDGNSTDGTIEIIKNICNIKVQIIIEPDFGIYDALNKAVKKIDNGYYLTVGADDILDKRAISNFRSAMVESNGSDLIAAAYLVNDRVCYPGMELGWLYGMPGIASSHSVALLINKSLHEKIGLYTKKLPIAADQLFVLMALKKGATIFRSNFIAGRFSTKGTSGVDQIGMVTELFRVQVLIGESFMIQFFLLSARLIKIRVLAFIGAGKIV